MFADMQRGHYVRNTSQTSVKSRGAKHAVDHLDPNQLSRGELAACSTSVLIVTRAVEFCFQRTSRLFCLNATIMLTT